MGLPQNVQYNRTLSAKLRDKTGHLFKFGQDVLSWIHWQGF